MPHLVFVFGTLKEGFPNFATNKGARIAGEFVTAQAFPLYLVGERCSPWMIDQPGQGHRVAGQLFEVDGETLARMDALERIGEADGYRRVVIDVADTADAAGAVRAVFAYLKPATQFRELDARHGPLSCYTLEHAALYRARTQPSAA
ncbi:MAG: gamma-glutamylcyclotransferase [Burkholderiales bacterium]|nr:gamma-glutamylcyclotransferase [Burkholderiales bacterium]